MLYDLYQELIIDHSKSPRNYGVLTEATHYKTGHNPLCGDQLVLSLIIRDHVIVDAKFQGAGCAISIASASLMTDVLRGKTVDEALKLYRAFHLLVTEDQKPTQDLGKLLSLEGVKHFPVRVKCATLAWHTFEAALEEECCYAS